MGALHLVDATRPLHLTYPLEDPVSRSVTILARIEPSNDSFNVSSVVSSDRPLTNRVLDGSGKEKIKIVLFIKVTIHNNMLDLHVAV